MSDDNEEFDSQQQGAGEEPASEQQKTDTESKRCTGPRTATGKNRAKLNSLRHGLFAQSIVLKNESVFDFDKLRRGVWRDLKPEGLLLKALADRIAGIVWRYPRLLQAERTVIQNEERLLGELMPFNTAISPIREKDLLMRCETHLTRELDRALDQYERARELRERQSAIVVSAQGAEEA